MKLDTALLLVARTRGHPPWLERGIAAYSRTGEHAACWLALGLGGLTRARTRAGGRRATRPRAWLGSQPGGGRGRSPGAWLKERTYDSLFQPCPPSRQARQQREFKRGLQIVAAAYALNYTVKLTVRRPRPQLSGLPPLSPTVSQLSFPSAHATTSFAAARAYSRMLPATPLYAAAAAFAFSRPYLGVHYPSDVIAGAVLGTALAGAWPG